MRIISTMVFENDSRILMIAVEICNRAEVNDQVKTQFLKAMAILSKYKSANGDLLSPCHATTKSVRGIVLDTRVVGV